MSKRSNRGKMYFYAKGQRDNINGVSLTGTHMRDMRKKLPFWAYYAWFDGYHGFML